MSKEHIFIDMDSDSYKGEGEINWKGYFDLFPDYKICIEKIPAKNDYIYILGYSEDPVSELGKKRFSKDGEIPASEDFQGPAIWRAKIEVSKIKEWRIFRYNKGTIKKYVLE